jgi:shikimate kinase
MQHLWLIGMMGSGKSEVGRRVAELTETRLIDLDEQIVAGQRRSISEIFVTEGEMAFRQYERTALKTAAHELPAVVATGGGVITSSGNAAIMRDTGTVIYLIAEPATLAMRIGEEPGRPLLAGGDRVGILSETLRQRAPLYEGTAHHMIETEGQTIDEIAGKAIGLWNRS